MPMPGLPSAVLERILRGALPPGSVFGRNADLKPTIIEVPQIGRVRVYLFTCTPDASESGRPEGEYKIQLIVSGQARGARAGLIFEDNVPTYLLGFCPDANVFVAWESRHYTEFGYSRNVQVRSELIELARQVGWAIAEPRRLRQAGAPEVRVAVRPEFLPTFMTAQIGADEAGLSGAQRQLFVARWLEAPQAFGANEARVNAAPAEAIEEVRRRCMAARILRDPNFAPGVKAEYGYACAICRQQLGVVHAAHIVPAAAVGAQDIPSNGIALCPNHHSLFDAALFSVSTELEILVDRDRLQYLLEERLGEGADALTAIDGSPMTHPRSWTDPEFRAAMTEALLWRRRLAGL